MVDRILMELKVLCAIGVGRGDASWRTEKSIGKCRKWRGREVDEAFENLG